MLKLDNTQENTVLLVEVNDDSAQTAAPGQPYPAHKEPIRTALRYGEAMTLDSGARYTIYVSAFTTPERGDAE